MQKLQAGIIQKHTLSRSTRFIAAFYLVYGLATAVRSYLEGIGDVVYSSFAGIVSLISRFLFSCISSIFYPLSEVSRVQFWLSV